jgi:hypothetical protein
MEATRLWIGEYFEAGYNPAYGAVTMQPMDASTPSAPTTARTW